MGEVYVGVDQKLERRVALKVIRGKYRLDSWAKDRFLREARILSQLEHPGICRIYDYIEGDGRDFLILELIRGRSLNEAMADGMGQAEKLAVAEQIAQVLVAAHGKGIIHRDLKPHNVMLTTTGEVKVLDFGVARPSRGTNGQRRSSSRSDAGRCWSIRTAAHRRRRVAKRSAGWWWEPPPT